MISYFHFILFYLLFILCILLFYVSLRQLVSKLVSQLVILSVSAFLFFKTHIRVLLDHVGSGNFAWK